LLSGAGSIADINDPLTSITGLAVGENIFQWSVSNGPCTTPTSTDQVSIFVFDQNNVAANAGPDQNLCTPTTSGTMAGSTVIFPALGTWTLVSGTGTIADVNDPATVITGLGIGENIFEWTVANGPCGTPTSDQVSIFLYDGNAPLADAGPDQNLCSDAPSTTLMGVVPVGAAVGTWSIVSGGATFVDPNDPNTAIAGLPVGETVLQWTIDNGSCGTSDDQISIFVYDASNAPAAAGPDQDLCTPITSTTLQANTPVFPATGMWTLISGTGTVVDPSNPTTTVSGLGVGTNVFEWTVDNGPCANPITSDQVSIVLFDGNAQLADAGADQNICSDAGTTVVSGNAPVGSATGQWTLASGTAVISTPNAPSTSVLGLGVGEVILVWSIDNGSCGLSNDSVSIFVYDANNPNADAGPDQDLCTPISSTTMNGSAVTSPAQGTWTLVSGSGTITDPNNPLTTITGLLVGANVFEWSVNNGPCTNGITTDQVTINIFDGNAQLADAGQDQSFCSPTSTAFMAANAPIGVAVGSWSIIQGTGTFTDPNDPNTLVNGLTVGENAFVWSIDNGSCGISTDTVSIFIFDQNNPAANAGADIDLCTPGSATTMSGSAITFPATGLWTVISGTAIVADPSDPNTAVSGLVVGTAVLEWSIDNGPCSTTPSSDLVTITVYDDAQPAANAGVDQGLCTPSLSTTMTANVANPPAIGTWSVLAGSGTVSNANNPTTVVSGLAVGENVFVWSIFNGVCTASITTDTVSIFVYDGNAVNANAGPDQSICTPLSTVSMDANTAIFPASGQWTLVSGGGTIADSTDPLTAITGLPIGENIFEWTIDNGPCTNGVTADQVSIFVFDDNNPVADAGPDILLCLPTNSTAMSASSVTFPATGNWSTIAGNGTFSDVSDPNATVNDLVVGINTFVWTVNNGPCSAGITSDTIDVILFDNGGVPSNAGPDQFLCTPTTATTMAGSGVTFPEIGVWLLIQGTGVIADINDPTTSVSGLSIGENILVWSVNNGPCPSGVTGDTVSIFVFDENNPIADAGVDQNLCTPNTSAVLAGSGVTFPASGMWTLVSGTGTIADVNDPLSAVSGLSLGENVFAWTVDNGPCPSGITSDTMSIFIFADTLSVADAGPDQALCTPNTTATMAGSPIVFPATGTWSVVSGSGTIADATDATTSITNIGSGVNVFEWTVDNGPCAAGITTDQITITVFNANAPAADAGADQEICTPTTTVALAGNVPVGVATGLWTFAQGTGVFADATDPTTTLSGLTVGEVIAVWTVDNGVCGITSDSVSIFTFDENNPPANVGPDIELCTPEDSLFMPGNVPTFPATAQWSVLQGPGVIVDVTDPNTLVTDLGYGNNIFVYQVDNGPCPGALTSDTLIVTLFSDTTAPADAGPDESICLPNTTTNLNAVIPTPPAAGTWSIAAGAGVFADPADPNTAVSGLVLGDNVFVWTLDNGPCPTYGITTDTVVITLFDDMQQAADAGPDQEACLPNTAVFMQANSYVAPAQGYWTVISGTANVVDSLNPNTVVDGLAIGFATLTWTIDNGPCPGGITTDTVEVRLYDPNAPLADAGPNDSICSPLDSLNLNALQPAIPGFGVWSLVAGTGVIADTLDPNTAVTGLSVGVNRFEWFVYNGFCGFGTITSRDTVDIYVFDENSPDALAGPDQDICTPSDSVTMAGNTPIFPAVGTWTSLMGSGNIVDPNDPNTVVNGLTVGQHFFVWTAFNGPCANSITSDTMRVRVYDNNAPVADAGPDQEICVPTLANQVTMAASQASFPGIGYWTQIQGIPAMIADTTDHATLVSDLQVGVNLFVWTVSNGPCWTTTDTMTVNVYDAAQPDADAGSDQFLCSPTASTALTGNGVIIPAVGTWTILSGSGTLTDANDPTTDITGLTIGQTTLVWSIFNGPCANSLTSDTVVIQVFDSNAPEAMAGPDQDYCAPINTTITMFANSAILPAIGTWVLLTGSATIVDPSDPFTEITNLGFGENVFEWQIDNSTCGAGVTTDQMSIFVYDNNEVAADAGPSAIYCQDIMEHQMAAVPTTSTGVGTWSLFSGTGVIVDPGDATTLITDLVEGMHYFLWSIDNGTCGVTNDTMLIFIEDCLTLTIPDAFSPNGDGINDFYVIDNLDSYPNNRLQIFNRWGNLVLDRAPYLNNWDGRSENSLNWGEELPESTYYYVLDVGDEREVITGYIYLKR
jgi:gliding motility-associated-like protein